MRTVQDIRQSVANWIETYATTNLSGLWKLVQRMPANLIRTTRTLSELVHRNIPNRARPPKVTMTRSDWVRT